MPASLILSLSFGRLLVCQDDGAFQAGGLELILGRVPVVGQLSLTWFEAILPTSRSHGKADPGVLIGQFAGKAEFRLSGIIEVKPLDFESVDLTDDQAIFVKQLAL